MPVKQTVPFLSGTFFITFTCHRWLPLIENVEGYDIVYKWFDLLKTKGHFINGYVIMPNHTHTLISFRETGQSINTIVGNGKRFMAYEIIKRLQEQNEIMLLQDLADHVEKSRKSNKKKHEVWELSFDWKHCYGEKFIEQKLDYMHMNPCTGKWNLSANPVEYIHSSAKYYATGQQGIYPITNIAEMQDIYLGRQEK